MFNGLSFNATHLNNNVTNEDNGNICFLKDMLDIRNDVYVRYQRCF